MTATLSRRVAAEFLGTGFLLAAIIGSGVMGERLAGGNVAIALLANTLATGAALVALILTFKPISGAHLNPVVTLAEALVGRIACSEGLLYVIAQFSGAVTGAICAHAMFSLPLFSVSRNNRGGAAHWFSEVVATFGLVLIIRVCARFEPDWIAVAVGSYITSAYWFTSSTSFANPAVTIARSLSDTFAGIRPADVGPFIAAQAIGAVLATVLSRWLNFEGSKSKAPAGSGS